MKKWIAGLVRWAVVGALTAVVALPMFTSVVAKQAI